MKFDPRNIERHALDMGQDSLGQCFISSCPGTPTVAIIELFVPDVEHCVASVQLAAEGDLVRVFGLIVHDPEYLNRGYGGALLQALCRYADKEQLNLYLLPERMPLERKGPDGFYRKVDSPSTAYLRKWYARQGGFSPDFMLRIPKGGSHG